MASGENIVHLTYKQLTEMAKKYDQEASKELPAERKTKERQRKNRPERAVYVPGQSHRTDISEHDLQPQGLSSARDRDVRSASPAAAQPSIAKQTTDFTQRRGSLTKEHPSGVGLRQSGREHGDVSVESKEDACESSTSRPQSGDQLKKEERAQRREKKPSIQIYVPRARNQQTPQFVEQLSAQLAEGRLTSGKGSLSSEAALAPRQSHAGSTSPPVAAAVPCALPESVSSRLDTKSGRVDSKSSAKNDGNSVKAAQCNKSVAGFSSGKSDKSKFDCERAPRNAREGCIREVKFAGCRPTEKQGSPGAGRNDSRNPAPPKCPAPDELDIELEEPFEWDHNADLDIGHSGGLNWGDLPTPPSDNEWSDEEPNCGSVTVQSGVAGNGKKKTGKRRRARKKAKAKSSETSVDAVGANPQGSREFIDADRDEDPDLNEVTDQFGGMVVTNSTMKGRETKPQCGDISNKTEFSEDHPRRAVDHEPQYHSSPKSYSNARWRRDGHKERGGRNVRSARRPEQKENDCGPEKPLAAEKTDVATARQSLNSGVAEASRQRQRTDSSSSGNVGGIIRLPVDIVTSSSAQQSDALNVEVYDGNHHRQHASPGQSLKPRSSGGGGGSGVNHRSGRAASSRVLWDPRNPDSRVPDVSSLPSNDRGNYRQTYPGEYPAYLPQQSPPVQMYYPDYLPPGTAPPHIAATDGYIYSYAAVGFDGMSYGEDPYYRGTYEQDLAAGQMRPGSRSKADQLLHEAASFDNQLQNLVGRRLHGDGAMDRLLAIRREILNRLEQLLLLDLEFSNRKNVEQLLWKSAFYQVIEMLRKQPDDEQSRRHLVAILDEGVGFFESLLQQLQTKHSFSLEPFLEPGRSLMVDGIGRATKLALITCQRIMICLGDLARYREQANHTSNYGRARSWYSKAQHVAPKNGRPYNQLAILALYTGRKLDAVYYYMRSLAASNPFLTARESLMQLFEDAAKKAESLDRTRQLEAARRKRIAEAESRRRRRSSEQGERVEIWIGVDGSSSSQGRVSAEDEDDGDDLTSLPMVELSRNFVLDFLRAHGKLFTKIGMEAFPETCGRLLRELELQLAHNPLPITGNRLLQLVAVNMFAVSNTEPKENQLDANCRSLLQEHAVQLGLDFFALLVRRCVELLRRHLASVGASCSGMDDDLTNLIPSVKSWSDWMTCYSQLWNPPPLTLDPELGPNVDVWQSLSDLFNCLSELDISDVKLHSQPSTNGHELVALAEDTELAGFVPLLSLSYTPIYVRSGTDKELARCCMRVSKLRMFADYLCGIDPPLMSYSVESHRYVSMVTPILRSSGRPGDQQRHSTERSQDRGSDDGDVVIEDVEETIVSAESSYASASEDGGGENAGAEQNISTLKARREELVKKVAEQTRLQENIKAAIDSTQQEFRAIQLEIRPQFLIPDTNCFIDHLRGLETIVASKRFTIVVPLVVLNELDGLSRGSRDRQYDSLEHAEMVRTGAKAAVCYLEKQFDERNSHLKALTAEGTTLTTIAFRSEQMKDPGKNDDLILSCCLYYCKDKARDFMPKSQAEPIRLQRDVVLLTNDRNLRLKAHVHNVPTRNVPAFLHWANIG